MNAVTCKLAVAMPVATATAAFAETDSKPLQQGETTARAESASTARAPLNLREPDTAFSMSNGRAIYVTSFGDLVSMRYGRCAAIVMRQGAGGSFVWHDGKLVLRFDTDEKGDAQRLSLSAHANWL